VVGAFVERQLVGTAGFYRARSIKERHKGHVWGVYVTPAMRGSGLGRGIMNALLEHASRVDGIEQIVLFLTACRLTIKLRPSGAGSEADVTYTHTSLGPRGDEFVASFTEAHYRTLMRDWEFRINHFLEHGAAC